MKTSVLLAVSALLAPGLGSAIVAKAQRNGLNQYENLNNCRNRENPGFRGYPEIGRCYDFEDNYHSFYWDGAGGNQYRPQMYYERGCNGRGYDGGWNQCYDRGRYQSYRILGGRNNNRDENTGEEEKRDDKEE